jgi:hypothetical protein
MVQEKLLQQLLMDETVARIKAQQELKKLSGKVQFLEERLEVKKSKGGGRR